MLCTRDGFMFATSNRTSQRSTGPSTRLRQGLRPSWRISALKPATRVDIIALAHTGQTAKSTHVHQHKQQKSFPTVNRNSSTRLPSTRVIDSPVAGDFLRDVRAPTGVEARQSFVPGDLANAAHQVRVHTSHDTYSKHGIVAWYTCIGQPAQKQDSVHIGLAPANESPKSETQPGKASRRPQPNPTPPLA